MTATATEAAPKARKVKRARPTAPTVVPHSPNPADRATAHLNGHAIGPVTTAQWAVTAHDGTIPFPDEDTARAYWHAHGGDLTCTETTRWTLSVGWDRRATT